MSRSRRQPVSEYERSGDEDEDVDEEGNRDFDVYGTMKTHLVWDQKSKHLCVALRQYAETPSKLELKLRGHLDTASGRQRMWGHVRKNFYTHTPSLQRITENVAQRRARGPLAEPNLDPGAWLPCGLGTLLFKDWTVAPGLSFDTLQTSYPLRYTLALRKNPQVLKTTNKTDLWLSAKSIAEVDPRSMAMSAGVALRLKAFRYRLTHTQGVSLTLGLDYDVWANGARSQRSPYFKVAESNMGVKLQRGQWTIFYEPS